MSGPRDVVRLNVNLASDVACALRSIAADQQVSVTEAVRRCISITKLLSDEAAKGNAILIRDGDSYRELVFL